MLVAWPGRAQGLLVVLSALNLPLVRGQVHAQDEQKWMIFYKWPNYKKQLKHFVVLKVLRDSLFNNLQQWATLRRRHLVLWWPTKAELDFSPRFLALLPETDMKLLQL